MTTTKPRITCLYARVSTLDQASGLESQVRALREFCERNSITDYEIFEDHGISGTKASRPSLDRMMERVKAGEVDRVIVHSFSRFARSTINLLNALEEFKKTNTAFTSLTEAVDTSTPVGKSILAILGAVAQLERDLLAERVKTGLKNARARGVHIGRKKQRPSDIIRMMLKKKIPFRTIASVCGCSHGAIWAESKEMKKEEEALLKAEQEKLEAQNKLDAETKANLPQLNPNGEIVIGGVVFPAQVKTAP